MIRHRNYYEMAAVVDKLERRFVGPDDTLLLYLPLAHNYGRLIHLQAIHVGYTLALCRDPLRVGEALAAVRPTAFPSVPRVYEKAHTAVVARPRRRPRAEADDRQLGARRRARRQPPPAGGRADPAFARAPPPDRRPARLLEGQGAPRRAAPLANSGGAPLAREIIDFFDARRPPDLRGLRPDRVHDRLLDQPARRVQVRHGRPAAAGGRGTARRGRRARDPKPHGLRRLSQGSRGHARGPAARTAGSAPATSPRSTTTASSRSPTARRTSSSPPAARTSRPRTSRTT